MSSFFYWVCKIFIWMQDNFFKDEKIVGKRNVFLQKKTDNNMCWAHKWQCSLKENGNKKRIPFKIKKKRRLKYNGHKMRKEDWIIWNTQNISEVKKTSWVWPLQSIIVRLLYLERMCYFHRTNFKKKYGTKMSDRRETH